MSIGQKLSLFKSGILTEFNALVADDFDVVVSFLNKPNKLLFENYVRFNSELLGGSRGIFLGAYSYMNSGGYVTDNTFIGRYCSIGRRVSIGAGMHRLNSVSTFPFDHAKTSCKPYAANDALNVKKKFSDPNLTA